MTLGNFTEAKILVPRLLSARHHETIKELSVRLQNAGKIPDAQVFSQKVLEREEILQISPNYGIVFPFARGQAIPKLALAAGLSESGIPWNAPPQGPRANIIILFAVPLRDTRLFIDLLGSLSQNGRAIEWRDSFMSCRHPEEMLKLLNLISITVNSQYVA